MGVVSPLENRSIFTYAELCAVPDLEFVYTPTAIQASIADFAVSSAPNALFTQSKDGKIFALWATYFPCPTAPRAPFVRVPMRRALHTKAAFNRKAA